MFKRSLALVLLAVFALPLAALAQEEAEEVDRLPNNTLVISSWACDISHLGEIADQYRERVLPVYTEMQEEGLVLGWGTFFHDWADEWNFNIYTVTTDKAAFFAAVTEAGSRISANLEDDAPNALLEYCKSHKDGIYVLGPRTE